MSDETTTVSAPVTEGPKFSFERERGVYAIHVTRDVAHVVVLLGKEAARANRISHVFRALADACVPIFLVKLHRTAVSFALVGADTPRAESALAGLGLETRPRYNLAIVGVLAASMRAVSGVMVDIGDALFMAGARLYATGDSHDSVLCLIESARAVDAVTQLCAAFQLDRSAVKESYLTPVAADEVAP